MPPFCRRHCKLLLLLPSALLLPPLPMLLLPANHLSAPRPSHKRRTPHTHTCTSAGPPACLPACLPAAQLVCTFTVVGVALVGKLWLGLPIPHALYPAAALMVAGSCMVMLPNIVVSSHLPACGHGPALQPCRWQWVDDQLNRRDSSCLKAVARCAGAGRWRPGRQPHNGSGMAGLWGVCSSAARPRSLYLVPASE